MYERISINPNVCHGQACVKGTRIPVDQLLQMMASGDSVETLLDAYPSLTREDLQACLHYADVPAEKKTNPPIA